jgi:hypothetical protein
VRVAAKITPIPNKIKIINQVRKLPYYASRQSYALTNTKTTTKVFGGLFCLELLGRLTVLPALIGLEAVGLNKQVSNIQKLDPEQRKNVPKGCLAARAAAWSLLGLGFVAGGLALSGGPLSTFLWAGGMLGTLLGLATLGIEKLVRGIKRNRLIKEIASNIETESQVKLVANSLRRNRVADNEEGQLIKAILKRSATETRQGILDTFRSTSPQAAESVKRSIIGFNVIKAVNVAAGIPVLYVANSENSLFVPWMIGNLIGLSVMGIERVFQSKD